MTRPRILLAAVLAAMLVAFLYARANTGKRFPRLSLDPATYKDCDSRPNCVCSLFTSGEPAIEPLSMPASDSNQTTASRLVDALKSLPRTTIVKQDDSYIHAEFRSFFFRYVDDVEFLIQPDSDQVHVRSASRMGYSDLGANRKRVEMIRELLQAN